MLAELTPQQWQRTALEWLHQQVRADGSRGDLRPGLGGSSLAEGAGEFSGPEKARFYRMAKRSATECAAVLDVARRLELCAPERLGLGRDLLLRIVSMLTKMVRAI